MSRNGHPVPSGGRMGASWAPRLRPFNTTGTDLAQVRSRSPESASSRSTARAELVPEKKLERQCTVTVNESYSPDEVLLNLDLLAEITPGTLVSITVAKPESEKGAGSHGHSSNQQQSAGDHGASAKGPAREGEGDASKRRYVFHAKDMSKELKTRHPHTELYVAKYIADNFGMKKGTKVILAPVDESNPAVEASHVELTFRDQYLARADMWRMTVNELTERTIYKGESVLFMGTIKAQVTAVFVEGQRVHSAFFSRHTRPIFRSESARYVLFIQMAREMWDFDSDGSGEIMFNKVVNGFLPALFKKWVLLKVRHLVTIVLFARVEYDAGLSDDISNGTLTDYYTGSQPSGFKRPYKDFYRVVVNEMASVEWATILKQLKKEFNVFRRDISLHHRRPDANFLSIAKDAKGEHIAPNRVKAISSLAMYGNLIEAVNLAASQYAHDYIDRDLLRTGISIVVISPGPGVFEVDYEALRRTTESLVGNGIGIDLICVPKIPLHSVPLFKYRNPQYTEQAKDRWHPSRGSTPKHGSLVGSYQSLVGSLSPKGTDLIHRADNINAMRAADEWSYAIPQWLHVSYWTGTSEDALSYQGIALSVNPQEDDTTEEFAVRCRMYDLQMRSVLETNEIETAPLMSDPFFPSKSIVEGGGFQRPRQTGSDEIAHVVNTKVQDGLFDHVYGFIKFAPDRTLKPGETSLWKQLQEYDNTRAKLPSSRRTQLYKSGRELDDSIKRQSLEDTNLFGTSLPERKPAASRAVSDSRKLSVNLGESGKVGRALMSPARPPGSSPAVIPQSQLPTSPTRPQKLMRHISLGQRGFGIAAPKAAMAEVRIETVSASNSSRPNGSSGRSSETSSSRQSLNRRPATPRSIEKRPSLFSPDSLRLDLPDAEASSSAVADDIPSTPSIPIIKKPEFFGASDATDPTKPQWAHASPLARKGRRSEDRDVKFSSVLRAEDAQKVYNSKLRAGALPDLPSTLSTTSAISPWLTVLNPSNPDANKVDDTMLFSRWQHVFPWTSKMKVMKWKALCCPAAVPLTTEYFPTKAQFESEYESKPYNISQNDDEDVTEETKTREDLLRELISLRFAQGFQVIVGPAVARAFGQRLLKVADIFARNQKLEDGASVFMSVGNTIHQLSCVNGSDVEVNIYSRRPPGSSAQASVPSMYKPAIRTLLDDAYRTRELDIASPRPERDWNYIDSYLAGHTDEMTENLRYWRARFVLIPVELRASALPRMHDEDNPEEIRIEGIRRLAQYWQRHRYVAPSERRYQSIAPRRRSHANPLDIVYKTEDPSVVIAAELETLPLMEGLEGIPRRGQLLSGKERFRRDSLNIAALAEAIQQPAESGGVRVQNRRWHLRMHYNCFIGSDMTTWLLDNFEDLESREEAEALGKMLMAKEDDKAKEKEKEREKEKFEGGKKERDSGLFVHVEKRHDFRDGQYFYQMSDEYAKPAGVAAGWFNTRKRENNVPSTPSLESVARDSPRTARAGSIQDDSPLGSASSTPTMTPAGGKKRGSRPRVMLSKMIKYDVDHRKRSYRPERINLHYDRLHNPDSCYHFRLEWMNVTAKLIEDAVESWAREAASFGLRLVEVPIKEACAITSMNPFKRPYLISLAAPPPDTYPEPYHDSSTQEQRNRRLYQRAILRRFDFVLDFEAASNFPADVDVSYSWGKPDFRYSQYIHRSGVLLAEITDQGDFLLMSNSLCSSRGAAPREKDAKDAGPRYAEPTSASGRVLLGSYVPEPAAPPGSPLSRSHVGSASPVIRPTVSGGDYYGIVRAGAADPEAIKGEMDRFCRDREGLEAFYRETLEKGAAAQTPGIAPGGGSVPVGPGGLEVVPEANIPSLGLPPGVLREREREASPARGFPGQGLGVAAFRRRSVQDGIGLGGGLQR